MKRAFRRILLFVIIGLGTLLLVPFALIALDLATISAGIYDDQAVASLPDKAQSVAIRRRPTWHPILGNEFHRAIILMQDGHEVFRREIEPDTGGYTLVHLFDMSDGNLLLTDGLYCYQLNLTQKNISQISTVEKSQLHFIGAFDEEGPNHLFRFFSAQERAQQPFKYTGLDWCIETHPK